MSDSPCKLEAMTANVPAKDKNCTADILEMIEFPLMRDMITGRRSKLTVVALQGKAQLGLILSIFLQLMCRDRLISKYKPCDELVNVASSV